MEKPTIGYLKDKVEIEFKKLCILFRVKYVWLLGIKHKLPEEWGCGKDIANNINNN